MAGGDHLSGHAAPVIRNPERYFVQRFTLQPQGFVASFQSASLHFHCPASTMAISGELKKRRRAVRH